MTNIQVLLLIVLVMFMISGILFVIFGQVTVRKLRKNPETKHALGIEFVSGWDILNTAQALAFPRSWSRKLAKAPLSSLDANADLLFKHTTKFDQILAKIFYWLLMATGVFMAIIIILDNLGYLES